MTDQPTQPANDKVYSIISQRGQQEVFGFSTVSVLQRLHWLVREWDVSSVIEVGSFLGMTSIFLADHGVNGPIVCVDLFDKPNNYMKKGPVGQWVKHPGGSYWQDSQYAEFCRNTLPYANIRHLKMDSLKAATIAREAGLTADLVYVDADHTYEGARNDILAWGPMARKVLCGDDNLNIKFGVTEAITDLEIPNREERCWWVSGEELTSWQAQHQS